MGLMDTIRGWFARERANEIEQAEELRRDPGSPTSWRSARRCAASRAWAPAAAATCRRVKPGEFE